MAPYACLSSKARRFPEVLPNRHESRCPHSPARNPVGAAKAISPFPPVGCSFRSKLNCLIWMAVPSETRMSAKDPFPFPSDGVELANASYCFSPVRTSNPQIRIPPSRNEDRPAAKYTVSSSTSTLPWMGHGDSSRPFATMRRSQGPARKDHTNCPSETHIA